MKAIEASYKVLLSLNKAVDIGNGKTIAGDPHRTAANRRT